MLNQRIWREDIYEKYGESATNDHRDNLFLGICINDNLNMYINDHLRMYTSDYALI